MLAERDLLIPESWHRLQATVQTILQVSAFNDRVCAVLNREHAPMLQLLSAEEAGLLLRAKSARYAASFWTFFRGTAL